MTIPEIQNKLIAYGPWTIFDLGKYPQVFHGFCKEMESRQYGGEETVEAFHWYLVGWQACMCKGLSNE